MTPMPIFRIESLFKLCDEAQSVCGHAEPRSLDLDEGDDGLLKLNEAGSLIKLVSIP